jgi:hypothetical protein
MYVKKDDLVPYIAYGFFTTLDYMVEYCNKNLEKMKPALNRLDLVRKAFSGYNIYFLQISSKKSNQSLLCCISYIKLLDNEYPVRLSEILRYEYYQRSKLNLIRDFKPLDPRRPICKRTGETTKCDHFMYMHNEINYWYVMAVVEKTNLNCIQPQYPYPSNLVADIIRSKEKEESDDVNDLETE